MELMDCLVCTIPAIPEVHTCLYVRVCVCVISTDIPFRFTGRDVTDGLVISSGYQSTYILPVVKGRFEASHCKRQVQSNGCHGYQ